MKTLVWTLLTAVAVSEYEGVQIQAQVVEDSSSPAPLASSAIVCDGIVTCESTYEPVCASDGSTFSNACQFKNVYCEHPREDFYIVSTGPCLQVQSIDGESARPPAVEFNIGDVPIDLDEPASTPPPPSLDDCDGIVACDLTYAPVCTSKGRKYRNACEYKNAYCEKPSDDFHIVPCDDNGMFQVQSVEEDDTVAVTNEVLNAAIEIEEGEHPKVQESDAVLSSSTTDPTPANTIQPSPYPPSSYDCSDGNLACNVPNDPVCASNGFTYTNECQFKNAYCEGLSDSFYILHKGPCESHEIPLQVQSNDEEVWSTVFDVAIELDQPLPQVSVSACADGRIYCGDAYAPVCASDGSTFRSECEFKNAFCENPTSGIHIISMGPCPISFEVQSTTNGVSPDVLNTPIELDEGVTEANAPKDVLRSPPKLSAYCTLICPTGLIPVAPLCGTDSRSYINDCHMLSAKCEKPDLEKQYDGLCIMGQPPSTTRGVSATMTPQEVSTPQCNSFCGRAYEPVCGSNGITYGNKCLFEFAQCQNPLLTILVEGKCAEFNSASISEEHVTTGCVPSVCPSTEGTVCGTDGQTYLNVCMLNNARCHVPGLAVFHDGACGAHTKLTCATLTCPRYQKCEQDSKTHVAVCVDICHADRCGPNEMCQVRETTECFTAPCAPVATCVPKSNAYADDY